MRYMYGTWTFVVLFTLLDGVRAHLSECPTRIKLQQGWIQGQRFQSTDKKDFAAFRGIPYAQPPLGALRFKPPVAAGPWTGILNATEDAPMCPQINTLKGTSAINEDCLYVNVYTPCTPRSRRGLPVLVFIHGGGFVIGDGGFVSYPPHRFMNEPVVLVSFNYRLGIFGFLSTASPDASGNYGLLDQRESLRWVQDNIERFGGDPLHVIIFGQSAGSASVMYQMISSGSKGFFHGAIAQSGAVLNHFAIQPDPFPYAWQLGQALQCNSGNNKTALIECLRIVSVQSLLDTMVALKFLDTMSGPFVPCLEDPRYGNFLTENPQTLLEKGDINHVPLIIGTNRDELALLFSGLSAAAAFDTIDDKFYNERLPLVIAKMTKRKTNLVEISKGVKNLYFDKIDVTNRTEVQGTAIDLVSHISFKVGTWTTSRILALRRFRVYLYSLEHAGNVSKTTFSGHDDVKHGDDLYYLFDLKPLTEGDEKFSRNLVKTWTNFAYFKNPTPFGRFRVLVWKTVGRERKLRYLKFGEDINTMEMQSDDMLEKENFWKTFAPYSVDPNV